MKAIVQLAYRSGDVLQLHDIDKPQLKADGVLVRVHAASINHGDCLVTTGVRHRQGLRIGDDHQHDCQFAPSDLDDQHRGSHVAIGSATRDGWLMR